MFRLRSCLSGSRSGLRNSEALVLFAALDPVFYLLFRRNLKLISREQFGGEDAGLAADLAMASFTMLCLVSEGQGCNPAQSPLTAEGWF